MRPLYQYIKAGFWFVFKAVYWLWFITGGIITVFTLFNYVNNGFQTEDFFGLLTCVAILAFGFLLFKINIWFLKNVFKPYAKRVASKEEIEQARQLLHGRPKDNEPL